MQRDPKKKVNKIVIKVVPKRVKIVASLVLEALRIHVDCKLIITRKGLVF